MQCKFGPIKLNWLVRPVLKLHVPCAFVAVRKLGACMLQFRVFGWLATIDIRFRTMIGRSSKLFRYRPGLCWHAEGFGNPKRLDKRHYINRMELPAMRPTEHGNAFILLAAQAWVQICFLRLALRKSLAKACPRPLKPKPKGL